MAKTLKLVLGKDYCKGMWDYSALNHDLMCLQCQEPIEGFMNSLVDYKDTCLYSAIR